MTQGAWKEFAKELASAVGTNYHLSSVHQSLGHWLHYDEILAEREIAFLAAHGIDTVRTFLNYDVWRDDETRFLAHLRHFVIHLSEAGIRFLPVLFDSVGLEPSGNLETDAASARWIKSPSTAALSAPEFPEHAAPYITAVVETINEAIADSGAAPPRWIADLWNEPSPADVSPALLATLVARARDHADAPETTVGFADFLQNELLLEAMAFPEALTVLSGHLYGIFREVVIDGVAAARELAAEWGDPPVFVSEVGLPGMFQYYGNVLGWLEEAKVGFTLWEAFVGNDQFRAVTGLFYPEPASEGTVAVRTTTAVNALWALVRRRRGDFEPPHLARAKEPGPGYVALEPARVELSTGAYHRLLRDWSAEYGTDDFPVLSLEDPATGTLYIKLMAWTLVSFVRFLTLAPATETEAREKLTALQRQYAAGNLTAAENALFDLFALVAEITEEHELGEPDDYAPEILSMALDTEPNPDGTTFRAHFRTVVFDRDQDALTVQFFVHDQATGSIFELPLTSIEGTTAHEWEMASIPLTHGAPFEVAVFVTEDGEGHDLAIAPVILP